MTILLQLEGNDEYLAIDTPDSYNGQLTQYRWVAKAVRTNNANMYFVGRDGTFNDYITQQATGFRVRYGGTFVQWSVSIPVSTDIVEWVVERDGDDHELFIDGISQGIQSTNATSSANKDFIGRANSAVSGFQLHSMKLFDAVSGGNLISNYDPNVSVHTAGTPIVTETVSGNNATGVNMSIAALGQPGSAWVDDGQGGDVPAGTTTIGAITTTTVSASIPFTYSDIDSTGFEYQLDAGTITATTSPIELEQLTINTAYSIKVRAINLTGAGAWSTDVVFNTDALVLLPSTLSSTVILPDGAQNGLPGNGFTCTGLDRFDNGTWLVGNHGKADTGPGSNAPSLVTLSSDFTTILNELDLTPILGAVSVQGVAIDPDGTYWIASQDISALVHITALGVELNRWTKSGVNGIALDPLSGASGGIWYIAQGGTEVRLWDIATNTETEVMNAPVTAADQLHYADDTLYLSYGSNGVLGSILIFDTITKTPTIEILALEDAEAIEGIYVDNNILTVMNDGGFHATANPINAALTYNVNFSGGISVTGATANYNYTGVSGVIELVAEITVVGQTANYNYAGINASIDLVGLITVIGQTANYDYTGIAADVIIQGAIVVTGNTANYDSLGVNATIKLQGPIVVNPRNIIMVKRKSNTVRVKRNSNTIQVR